MKFEKPALKISDQIALLQRRGMTVSDAAMAEHYLEKVSYYRLRGYWIPLEAPAAAGDYVFQVGTTFEQVIEAYNFDRELRLLVLDAIERIEVAIRGQWAHHFAVKYGPHSHLYKNLFKNDVFLSGRWRNCRKKLAVRATFSLRNTTQNTQILQSHQFGYP